LIDVPEESARQSGGKELGFNETAADLATPFRRINNAAGFELSESPRGSPDEKANRAADYKGAIPHQS
jgi:hypothetical protein